MWGYTGFITDHETYVNKMHTHKNQRLREVESRKDISSCIPLVANKAEVDEITWECWWNISRRVMSETRYPTMKL